MSRLSHVREQANSADLQSKDELALTGQSLLLLAGKGSLEGRRQLFYDEARLIDEAFQKYLENPQFSIYVLRAVRKALETRNYNVVRVLLEPYCKTQSFLRNEVDVLQVALLAKGASDRAWTLSAKAASDEALNKLLPELIEHGAALDTHDAQGNTPLYYACIKGLPKVFKCLIDRGANFETGHMFFPQDSSSSLPSAGSAVVSERVNLLQVTLDACAESKGLQYIHFEHSKTIPEIAWNPIVEWLIDAGQRVPANNPGLSRVFHLACFLGNLNFMKKLLQQHGVDIEAEPAIAGRERLSGLSNEMPFIGRQTTSIDRPDSNDISFSSALHAAAYGGSKEAVLLLLQHGANPRAKATQLCGTRSCGTQPLTPLGVALESLRSDSLQERPHADSLLDACMALVDAGAGHNDQGKLLTKASTVGNLAIVQRLLRLGARADTIHRDTKAEIVPLLLEHNMTVPDHEFVSLMLFNKSRHVFEAFLRCGTPIDASVLELAAASLGWVDTLKGLVEKHGRKIQVFHEMFRIFHLNMLTWKNLAMVRYLACEYLEHPNTAFQSGYNFPDGFGGSEKVATNALAMACGELCPDAVRVLLEGGADIECPGLPCKAYYYVQQRTQHQIRQPIQIQIHQMLYAWETGKTLRDCYPEKKSKRVSVKSLPEYVIQQASGVTKQEFLDNMPDRSSEPPRPRSNLNAEETAFMEAVAREWADYRSYVGEHEQKTDSDDEYGSIPDEAFDSTPSRHGFEASDSTNILDFHETKPAQTIQSPILGREFCYKVLSAVFDMRLLLIHSSASPSTPLYCSLEPFNLNSEHIPAFEALSYVWGEQTNRVNISLNDSDFSVANNLWSALNRLRSKTESRWLWIDAICINQNDLSERSKQVSIMREIYRKAWRVVVWLGEEDQDSQLVFRRLNDRSNDYYMYDPRIQTWLNDDGEPDPHEGAYGGRLATAFEKLCRRPWFFRTWIIQEIALSREQEGLVLCGGHQTDWFNLPELDYDDTKLCSPLREISGPMHLGDLQGLSHSRTWRDFLSLARHCGATDPRDKIYGLMGLFERQIMSVDYTLDVADVFRNFTNVYIEECEDLYIFHLFPRLKTLDKPLPSWLVDFGDSNPVSMLPKTVSTSRAKQSLLAGWTCNGTNLTLRGKYVATIDYISDELTVDPLIKPDTQDFRNVMRDWETTALRLTSTKSFSGSVSNAFGQVLVACDKGSIPKDDTSHYSRQYSVAENEPKEFSHYCHAFCKWYGKFGAGMLRQAEGDYFDQVLGIKEGLTQSGGWSEEDLDVSRYEDKAEAACYGRKLFTTRQGSLGLAPPGAQVGDHVIFFPGALYPFVLRYQAPEASVFIGDCYLYDFDEDDNMPCVETYVIR